MSSYIEITENDFDEFDFFNSVCHLPLMEKNTLIVYVKNFHHGDIEVEEGIFEFRNVNFIDYKTPYNDKSIGKRKKLVSKSVNFYTFASKTIYGDDIEVSIECSSCIFTQL